MKKAVEEIKNERDTAGLTEATIILTQDIIFKAEEYPDDEFIGDNYFSGIENVTLTLTSDDKGPHKIERLGATFSYNQQGYLNFEGAEDGSGANARLLTGAMILDNIIWDTHEDDYLFAQGHKLVFTENFQNTEVISVVGGNLGTQYRQDGKGFEGRGEPGLTDNGELAAWNTMKDGTGSAFTADTPCLRILLCTPSGRRRERLSLIPLTKLHTQTVWLTRRSLKIRFMRM